MMGKYFSNVSTITLGKLYAYTTNQDTWNNDKMKIIYVCNEL